MGNFFKGKTKVGMVTDVAEINLSENTSLPSIPTVVLVDSSPVESSDGRKKRSPKKKRSKKRSLKKKRT